MSNSPLCVGLTGGIGCGKSTVAQLFEVLGAGVIDTDAIALQLTQAGGEAMAEISQSFGIEYLTETGALNRAKMRQLIFSDSQAKQQLQKILHPLILKNSKNLINQLVTKTPYILLMVPLLLESPDFMALVQRILVVDCSEIQQIARVKQRSGLAEKEIRTIINQQTAATERLARADDIIHNDGLQADLSEQVARLHQLYSNNNNKNRI